MINTVIKSTYQSSIHEECTEFRFVDSEIDSWRKKKNRINTVGNQ